MSNALLPNLPLICAGMTIEPLWSTQVSDSSSSRQYTLAKRVYPTWRFTLPFNMLRAGVPAEYESLVGFFNARRGRSDDFLFQNPKNYLVSNQVFGTGDGTTTSFELNRNLGGFVEPVGGTDAPSLLVKVNGVATAVTLNSTLSSVVFAQAPAAGAVLSWSGRFYHRVRFTKDALKFTHIAGDKYHTTVEFQTYRL